MARLKELRSTGIPGRLITPNKFWSCARTQFSEKCQGAPASWAGEDVSVGWLYPKQAFGVACGFGERSAVDAARQVGRGGLDRGGVLLPSLVGVALDRDVIPDTRSQGGALLRRELVEGVAEAL